jgi:hypothetical protein
MNEHLGRALQEGVISEPPTPIEWLEPAYHGPRG